MAAIIDGGGHITGLALEHFILRKNHFLQTLRFKVYVLCVVAIATIGTLVLVALLAG